MSKRKRSMTPVDVDFTLRRVFGKKSFRPLQREVISACIERQDVFLQAATSFGKSLCFQLPAVISSGITVVVSPLLALMNNQVAALERAGIPVATINSSTPPSTRDSIKVDLLCGHPRTRLLYVTPELCQTDSFRKTLTTIHQQGQLERIAIDEAHCISEWGHDFRTAYKELSWFKRCLILPSVPIIALTATATPRIQSDIVSSLSLDTSNLKLYAVSTARPNLHYEIRYTNDAIDPFPSLVDWLKQSHERRNVRLFAANPSKPPSESLPQISGIIYTRLRTSTEALAAELRSHGVGAAPYHAGLPATTRTETQTFWLENKPGYAVIVATTAFGMGIDKDDVRFVVHWDLPKSFEGFYQEAGRAGRDGRAALNIVYYSREERDKSEFRVANDGPNQYHGHGQAHAGLAKKEQRLASFKAFASFCESTTQCRHEVIRKYFAGGTSPAAAAAANMPAVQNTQVAAPTCNYACDFCKLGAKAMKSKKEKGLASEEDAGYVASQWANQAEIEAGLWDD